jgi:hypothetical protein
MRIARNVQKEGEKRPVFLWFPVWNEDEILWLEVVNHYWLTNSMGMVGRFYERISTNKQ